MQSKNSTELRRAIACRLETLQYAGVVQLPRGKKRVPQAPPAPALPVTAAIGLAPSECVENDAPKGDGLRTAPATLLFDAGEAPAKDPAPGLTLQILQQQVGGCTRCDELARTRKQTVFGVGNANARLCFLGEAPGADEDRLGEPFVGRAGQLLTKIIEACRMKRDDVYILNMIKCRPPGNRNPLPHELTNCREYLESQFALIKPEFICCLGAVAAQNLLGTTLGIGKLRGKIHAYRDAKVVCTYHPAFLLRSPSFKKETWEDMKMLMREMGVDL
jgi:uracil-DNA glycosylase